MELKHGFLKTAFVYGASEGGGCVDVGRITMQGFTLVSDSDLKAIQEGQHQHLIDALNLAAKALITPQGTFKTRKADEAYHAIKSALGPSMEPEGPFRKMPPGHGEV